METGGGAQPMRTDAVRTPGTRTQVGPPERSDEQLMTAAARGDLRSFDRLVRRHHGTALKVAYHLCGDEDRARDLAQEAFLRILRAAGRYRERGRFTTYLYAVVLNLVREEARRRRRRPEVPLPPDGRPVGPAAGASAATTAPPVAGAGAAGPATAASPSRPDRDLDRRELARGLEAALAALSPDQRDVFVLSELEGLRYEEIAVICGCPAGTVASRKHEAVRRLRRLLAPWR